MFWCFPLFIIIVIIILSVNMVFICAQLLFEILLIRNLLCILHCKPNSVSNFLCIFIFSLFLYLNSYIHVGLI